MKTVKPQNTALVIITVFIFTILYSCATKPHTIQNHTVQEASPKLIFLNYQISEAENGKKEIDFINKIVTDGKLKNSSNKYVKTGIIGDLKCTQFDNKSREIQHVFIKNPFNKTVEFVNDSLQLNSKTLKLKQTTLSLRLQLNQKTKQIVIAEIIDSLQHTKHLITTKLKTK